MSESITLDPEVAALGERTFHDQAHVGRAVGRILNLEGRKGGWIYHRHVQGMSEADAASITQGWASTGHWAIFGSNRGGNLARRYSTEHRGYRLFPEDLSVIQGKLNKYRAKGWVS